MFTIYLFKMACTAKFSATLALFSKWENADFNTFPDAIKGLKFVNICTFIHSIVYFNVSKSLSKNFLFKFQLMNLKDMLDKGLVFLGISQGIEGYAVKINKKVIDFTQSNRYAFCTVCDIGHTKMKHRWKSVTFSDGPEIWSQLMETTMHNPMDIWENYLGNRWQSNRLLKIWNVLCKWKGKFL